MCCPCLTPKARIRISNNSLLIVHSVPKAADSGAADSHADGEKSESVDWMEAVATCGSGGSAGGAARPAVPAPTLPGLVAQGRRRGPARARPAPRSPAPTQALRQAGGGGVRGVPQERGGHRDAVLQAEHSTGHGLVPAARVGGGGAPGAGRDPGSDTHTGAAHGDGQAGEGGRGAHPEEERVPQPHGVEVHPLLAQLPAEVVQGDAARRSAAARRLHRRLPRRGQARARKARAQAEPAPGPRGGGARSAPLRRARPAGRHRPVRLPGVRASRRE